MKSPSGITLVGHVPTVAVAIPSLRGIPPVLKVIAWPAPGLKKSPKSIWMPTTSAERSRTWRKGNSDSVKEYRKQYRTDNREAINRKRRDYYTTNRKRVRSVATQRISNLKEELYSVFGNKCVKCGFGDKRALQLDHIEGGGTQERRTKTATQVWRNAINHPQHYQMLCANCNSIKRYTDGEI